MCDSKSQALRYLEDIARKLWCGRDPGQVSVMVGSGFSRNAMKNSPQVRDLPLWNDLRDGLLRRLYGDDIDNNTSERYKGTSGIMKLATEFESFFCRNRLNKFIEEMIPISKYSPGPFHEELLELPWADVFTTNYDDFLERCFNTRYTVVNSVTQLSDRLSPRIVKLHGTIGQSSMPYIITEEDYRQYPEKHAPFVNLVRQSLVENSLCLIGFSGDDPNFHSWIGWIRDYLKEHANPIYLYGYLNFKKPQVDYWEKKGVKVIDLAPFINVPDPLKHQTAVAFLLSYLKMSRPFDREKWPNYSNKNQSNFALPDSLKKLLPVSPNAIDDHSGKFPNDSLDKRIKYLTKLLETYPDWLVCPYVNRKSLLSMSERIIYKEFKKTLKADKPKDIELAFLLNWLLEKALIPLDDETAKIIEEIVDRYDINNKTLTNGVDQTNSSRFDWSKINKMWIELMFAIAREAREDLNEVRFAEKIDSLEKHCILNKDLKARIFFEKCMFALNAFDFQSVKQNLSHWPEDVDDPIWNCRKAMVSYEYGNIEGALNLVNKSLQWISEREKFDPNGYWLLSRKAIAENLKSTIIGRYDADEASSVSKNTGFSPTREIEQFYLELVKLFNERNHNSPESGIETIVEYGFDRGKYSIKRRWRIGFSFEEFVYSLGFIRFLEEIAMPVNAKLTELLGDTINMASEIGFEAAKRWMTGVKLRTGDWK
ncbi:MAG: SIR2 family NAD-dependent protein deacylase [Candidatus Heimdallarchaeaceae archaeon]